ncbi:hypothetical protein [Oryza sativa Japonica Group]|uniref:Uncharacterized protein n=1 Tax=Oryza sativa subsp. japonica TaxID=39947 RepID=Q658D4_ORYSJ|nr:hypothetical protein [Oryza sativa Japonica Group]
MERQGAWWWWQLGRLNTEDALVEISTSMTIYFCHGRCDNRRKVLVTELLSSWLVTSIVQATWLPYVESTLDVTWQMTAVDVEHGGSDMECARVLAL